MAEGFVEHDEDVVIALMNQSSLRWSSASGASSTSALNDREIKPVILRSHSSGKRFVLAASRS